MRNFILFFIIQILIPINNIYAIPAITVSPATITDGDTVNVTGTDMTVKATGSPLSYLDGEGTTEGQVLNDSAYEQNTVGAFTYTANGARGGKNAVYTIIQDYPDADHLYYDGGVSGFTDQFYMTFWTKLEPNGEWVTPDASDQIKWISLRTKSDATGAPNAGYNMYPTFKRGETFDWVNFLGGIVYDSNYGSVVYINPISDIPTSDVYFRVELYGKRGSGFNVADGTWNTRLLQVGKAPRVIHNTSSTITHSASDELWRYAGFRNEIVNSETTQNEELKQWIHGFYIDESPNRFEIGNNSDFNSCTHREIQETITGGDTSGSFTAYQGELLSNTTYYLFKVDNNNTASTGVEITFAATPTPTTSGTIKGFVISGAVIK